eukprot:403341194
MNEVINIAFIGGLNNANMLAGVGLGNLYINTFGIAVYIGLNVAAGTFVSQSIGQNDLRLAGVYLNRGRIVSFISFVPIFIAMIYSDKFFGLLNQDPQAVEYAYTYILYMIPYLLLHQQFDLTRTFLACFNKTTVTMITQIFSTFLHFCFCYYFVKVQNMNLRGVALSGMITMLFNVLATTFYIKVYLKELSPAFFLPNKQSFMGIPAYMKLAVSSMCIYCLEWWAMEVITIIASQISINQLGAQVIILNIYYVYMSLGYGLSYASEILIGKCIGANNIKEGKEYRRIIMQVGFALSALAMLTFYAFRYFLAEFFTPIIEIQDYIIQVGTLSSFCLFFELSQAWLQGFLRGLGTYNHALVTVLIAFYCLMIPLAYYLAIVLKMQLFGIWIALTSGQITLCLMYVYLSHSLYDWQKISDEVQVRAEIENNQKVKDSDMRTFKESLIES